MAEMVNMPKLGFDMAEGTLIRWVIAEGESVTKGAVLAEIETDKATVEVEFAYEGVVRKHLVAQGTVVPVGQPIAIIAGVDEKIEVGKSFPAAETVKSVTSSAKEMPAQPSAPAIERLPSQAVMQGGQVRVSPLARRMAEEEGIDLRMLQGSGPGGRVVKKDIEAYIQIAKPGTAVTGLPPLPVPSTSIPASMAETPIPGDRTVPISRIRSIIGRRMVEAKQQVPHIYLTHVYDMAQLMELRNQLNQQLGEGERLSVNDFIVKAVALALRQFPNLNASLSGENILQHGRVNVGVAVAVDGGLLTVVCHDADQKPIRQISTELRSMVGRARQGKVRPEDIEGSTFSLSNLGMFDISHFVAIVNPPEAAILAVGAVMEVPVVKNGVIQPGLRMHATLSVDHRISDGAEGARFLQSLALYLEQPWRLLI